MKKVLLILSSVLLFSSLSFAQVTFDGNSIVVTLEQYGQIQIFDAQREGFYQIDRLSPLIGGNVNEVMDYYNDMDDVESPMVVEPATFGDVELHGIVDNNFSGNPPAYEVAINIYGWNDQPYVLGKFTITNISGGDLDARAGFEILPQIDSAYGDEKMEYLESMNAFRVYRPDSSTNVGFKILSPDMTTLKVIEWYSGYNDSDEDLFSHLLYGMIDSEYQSGIDGTVIFPSVDAMVLADGESMVVYLAVALGADLTEIETNLTNAEEAFGQITSVEDSEVPLRYSLAQNYPNPFNPSTSIEFSIPKQENVKIDIYNAIGQKVAQLLNKKMTAGAHEMKFNASDLPSGIYFYSIEAGNFSMTKKMMLIK